MSSLRADLEAGAVTPTAVRRGLVMVLAVALIWRMVPLLRVVRNSEAAAGGLAEGGYLGPFLGAGFGLKAFLTNPGIAWVGSPLYLLATSIEVTLGTDGAVLLLAQSVISILITVVVYRIALKLLGLPAAMLAALMWAVSHQAVSGALVYLPELAFGLASALFAARMLDAARRREVKVGAGVGFHAGVASLLSGMGALWLPFSLAWLPTQTRRFQRRGWLILAGLVVGLWLAVLLPGLIHGVAVQHDLIFPFANAPYDFYQGTEYPGVFQHDDDDRMVYPVGRWARSIHQMELLRGADAPRGAAARGAAYSGMGLGNWSQSQTWSGYARRLGSFFGGGAPGPAIPSGPAPGAFAGLPLLPLEVILVLSWLGGFALLGSLRSYAPLYMGLAIPVIIAVFTGVTARGQLAALPFLCLFAGYGVARVWVSRRWPLTWVMAPILASIGVAFILVF